MHDHLFTYLDRAILQRFQCLLLAVDAEELDQANVGQANDDELTVWRRLNVVYFTLVLGQLNFRQRMSIVVIVPSEHLEAAVLDVHDNEVDVEDAEHTVHLVHCVVSILLVLTLDGFPERLVA